MVDANKISMSLTFVGLDGAGKTTLLRQIGSSFSKEILPTAGFEIHYLTLQIFPDPVLVYDCSGQGRSRENWTTFYEYSDGIGFVIDMDDNDRLTFVKRCLDDILRNEIVQKRKLPIYFFLNKQDIKNRMDVKQLKQFLELDQKKRKFKNPMNWKEVSAFEFNTNEVQECFQWLRDNRFKKVQNV